MNNSLVILVGSINAGIALRCKEVCVPKTKKNYLILEKLQILGFVGHFNEIAKKNKIYYLLKLKYNSEGPYIKSLRVINSKKNIKNFNFIYLIKKKQSSISTCLFDTSFGILDSNEIISMGLSAKILLEVV